MFRSYETSDNMILIDGNILESLNKSSIGQQLMTKIRLGFRNTRWRVVVIGTWCWSCRWSCCCLGCLCSGSCCRATARQHLPRSARKYATSDARDVGATDKGDRIRSGQRLDKDSYWERKSHSRWRAWDYTRCDERAEDECETTPVGGAAASRTNIQTDRAGAQFYEKAPH